jgi:HPt (histidine-containing phosphotransfer) domain-containing protein
MDVLDQTALEALRELHDEGEDDLLIELIDLFLEDAPTRMNGMRDAIGREDWPAVASWAHSLKGSCGSLGAMHMAEHCNRLEQHGRLGGPRQHAELMFAELEAQYVLVRDALQRERSAPR